MSQIVRAQQLDALKKNHVKSDSQAIPKRRGYQWIAWLLGTISNDEQHPQEVECFARFLRFSKNLCYFFFLNSWFVLRGFCCMMSEQEDAKAAVNRPPKRKLLRKRQNRDDIFSYKGQIPLSFRTKQVKVDTDSSDSDNDDAFQRVHSEDNVKSESLKARDSDSDREGDDM